VWPWNESKAVHVEIDFMLSRKLALWYKTEIVHDISTDVKLKSLTLREEQGDVEY
jgi:hypothetical protein